MAVHKVELKVDAAGHGSFSVDGKSLPVKSFTIRGGVHAATEVDLTLIGTSVDANVLAELGIELDA